jgi:hypothetical protein
MIKREMIEVSEDELIELVNRLCDLGQSMNIEPIKFSVMLSMAAKHMSDVNGLEVHSVRAEIDDPLKI